MHAIFTERSPGRPRPAPGPPAAGSAPPPVRGGGAGAVPGAAGRARRTPTLCQRVERYRTELFTFVADPAVPPTNNAAERALRPLVIARKISGGTRSNGLADPHDAPVAGRHLGPARPRPARRVARPAPRPAQPPRGIAPGLNSYSKTGAGDGHTSRVLAPWYGNAAAAPKTGAPVAVAGSSPSGATSRRSSSGVNC